MDTQAYKEVHYDKYCKTCKNKKVAEKDEPCNECLNKSLNLNSHKPVNYEKETK